MLAKAAVAANATLAAAAVGAVIAAGGPALTEPAAAVLAPRWADPALAVAARGLEALLTAALTAGGTGPRMRLRVGAVGVEQKKPVDD